MSKLIRIPWKFHLDHFERGLPTPTEVKHNKTHAWVSADDPALNDLYEDAVYYADRFGPDACAQSLKASARATVKAIKAARD